MWKYTNTKECNEFLLSLNLWNCKEEKKYIKTLYSLSNQIEKNYRIKKIKKKNGKTRTLYEPTPLLKHIQRKILENILEKRKVSTYAKAYQKGISLKENAKPHVKKDSILKLDIKNFFDNITLMNVYTSSFPIEYFPPPVGMLLTKLCTYKDYLPQGAPTSSYISNLVMKEFDEAIGTFCEEKNISYTRYSDDMTFSGNFLVNDVIKKVKQELQKLNLKLNNNKIHRIRKSANQNITGLTVNEKIQVNKKYRSKIRQEIYYIQKYGLKSHLEKLNIETKENIYLRRLYGKITYVLQINHNDKEFKNYKKIIEKEIKNENKRENLIQ